MANSLSDFMHGYSLRVFDNLPVPILTVTGEGTAGTTLYEYKATFKTLVGESLPSDVASIATGNATLNGFNKNKLSVLEIPPATTKVRYWKNAWTYYTQTIRENSTSYTLGEYMVLTSNSQVRYQCTTAGTSASSDPGSWPSTLGNTKVDGTVVWTAVTNKNDTWVLLGEVDPDPGQLYDTGQSTTVATIPTEDTSGRPGVIAILPKPGTMIQRAERIDTMSLFSQMVQDGFDLIHKSGDVISGCAEYQIDGNLWGFTEGQIYFLGRFIDVPAGQVTLTGSGEEKVGVVISPLIETADDDHVWRCGEDEGVAGEYANTGPDVLYFEFAWVKDTDTQLTIKEFVDGVPKTVTLSPERTELDKRIAYTVHGLAGHYSVIPFGYQVVDHPTNDEKLQLKIGAGRAVVNGFEINTVGTRSIDFDKARDVKAENNSGIDVFSYSGADNDWNWWTANTVTTLGTIRVPTNLNGYRYEATARDGDFETGATEPIWTETPGETVVDNDITWTCLDNDYDLNGLDLTVKVGDGNIHTVSFTSDNMAASAVVTEIENTINAYPTDGTLVNGTAAEAILQLTAIDGKTLTLGGTALDELGWASGTTTPEGTRIYRVNDNFVKTVTDMNYKAEEVAEITHNGTTHKDLLPNSNVVLILGAATSEADAHDEKWDYQLTIDYIKDGNYISFAGVGGAEPGSGSTYYVKYQYNRNAIKGSRHLCTVVDAKVVKTGEDLADNLTFTDATSITRVNGGAAVVPTGSPKDVVEILRVNNSPGQGSDQYTSYSLLKNSDALSHETSQIDWSEAGTPGTTGAGQPSNSATYYVTYTFWHHATEGDYVAADSYDDYPSIEMAPNGIWYLRDCIDFRTNGGTWPIHGEDPTFDYEYYLARVDKLVLSDTADFTLIEGAPAKFPPVPSDQASSLSLATLTIAPYTYSTADVVTRSVEPVRLSQRKLQDAMERIERLEYYSVVNTLEKEIAGHEMEADKQGFFSDALTGFGRLDGTFNRNGVAHTVSLDLLEQCLLLPASQDLQIIEVDVDNSNHIRRAGNSIMLDYQPQVYTQQLLAGITVNGASDFVFTDYYGHMSMSPSTDAFIDSEQLPTINVDFDDSLSALVTDFNARNANNIEWGSWNRTGRLLSSIAFRGGQAEWFGATLNHGHTALAWETTRTGTRTTMVPGGITYDLGDRVVDMTIQGMMRTLDSDGDPYTIQLDIRGLMPNVDHACTFAGKVVDLTYDSTPDNAAGAIGSNSYQTKTTVRSSNDGCLTATVVVPAGVPVGSAEIYVFYYADPETSFSKGVFTSVGFMQSNQKTTIGMPATQVETVIGMGAEVQITGQGADPLAQTFVVKDTMKYLSAVELFFQTKSSTSVYTVQMRSVVNGYPGPDVFATKTLYPSEINTSTNGSTGTLFTFDNVLGYKPGVEYCFVGLPGGNSTDFNLFCSELGTVDFISGQRITTQTHEGVLFHSPNNRTWEPWTKRDLKFKIYYSNFENDCQIVFKNLTGVEASILVMKVDEFVAPGVNVKWAYSTNGGTSWINFNPKIDVDLEDIITQVQLRVDVTSLGGNYQIVDKFAGIVLLLHELEADYIGRNQYFTDPLYYPNKVTAIMDIYADGVNGTGTTTVTPFFTVDDGVTWVELAIKEGFTPVAKADPYYNYVFETPDEASITGATNASPIVVTSASHSFKENAVVLISGVQGNTAANGVWRATNVAANTFELYDISGNASVGNGAYTTGGTIVMNEFSQLRLRVNLSTSNKARTPRVQNIGLIGARA